MDREIPRAPKCPAGPKTWEASKPETKPVKQPMRGPPATPASIMGREDRSSLIGPAPNNAGMLSRFPSAPITATKVTCFVDKLKADPQILSERIGLTI